MNYLEINMPSNIETIVVETTIATTDFLPEERTPLNATLEVIKEAIWCSQGNITRASKILDCSHSSLWHYINNKPDLKTYVILAQEYRNDIRADVLEDLAFNKSLYGDTTLIWKLLCTYASKRGYGDKQSLEVKHDIPPQIQSLLDSLNIVRSLEIKDAKPETSQGIEGSNKEDKPL